MKKILFLIHDLGHGGAEKVLVNLVNYMDPMQFEVTVMALFGGGINEQFLRSHIRYQTVFKKSFPGNSHVMKLFSPEQLHKAFIKEHYDIEVAYLEGPSARIISGCPDSDTKLVSWIHGEQKSSEQAAGSFKSVKEAGECYNCFHKIIAVSETVKQNFQSLLPINVPIQVLYNTNESEKICALAKENVDVEFNKKEFNLVGVGKLLQKKGFDRQLRIVKKLRDANYPVHLYILGVGPKQQELEQYIHENQLDENITLLGYQTNPYKYVAKCDLFVCASHAEGFSTAATEALIVGTPVCTVEVSGMKEMLGNDNEYGIVTENTEDALYEGLKQLLDDPIMLMEYKNRATKRGESFKTEQTVNAVEQMLLSLVGEE